MPSSPWREEEGGTFVGGLVIVQRYMCVRLSVCVCMCVRGAHMSKDACLFMRICQWYFVCLHIYVGVCVCVCVYMCARSTYVTICLCVYTYMSVYLCVCVCVCVCVC